MIISGRACCNRHFWAEHLQRTDTNEHVRVVETRGLLADDIEGALQEMAGIARGARAKDYFYVASLNPRPEEALTPEQWEQSADIAEKHLGLIGQPRFIVQHEKAGRIHEHAVWLRIKLDTMTAISDSLSYRKHQQAAREIEQRFGLEPVESVLVKGESPRPERRPRDWETFRAQETGIDPQEMKAQLAALWQAADSGLAFKAALEDAGYILARGDRRDFCVIDQTGDEHSLGRRTGIKAAEIRTRMADVDRTALPSVAEARALARAAADSADAETPPEAQAEPATTRAAALQPVDAAAMERAAQRAGALSDVTADITPEVEQDLAQRFGDRTEVPALERGSDSELAPVEKGAAQEAPALERGTPPDTSETHFGWRAFADRVRGYVDRAFAVWRDESSGTPDGECGPWERFVGAARHLIRGYTRRDIDELIEGAREATGLFRGDETSGSKPATTDNANLLPTDSGQAAQRAEGEDVLRHFEMAEGEHSPPGETPREPAGPDAQVDASGPADRPQPETPAVTKPMSAFDHMTADYFAGWDAGEDPEIWPDAEPIDGTAPQPPEHHAPDMD